jgi:hypothetical protein
MARAQAADHPDDLQGTLVLRLRRGLSVFEYAIWGLLHGDSLAAALGEFFAQKGMDEVLASSLVVLVALIPFFAMKELGRVLGRERIAALFFRNTVER